MVKAYVRYVFLFIFLAFVVNKTLFRPWVLENDSSEFLKILVLSFPNFAEAILGTLLLTTILMVVNQQLGVKLKIENIQWVAFGLASFYVITQELKFHNLGGQNVYDPYDLAASIIGLILTITIIRLFGYSENKVSK